MSILRTYLEALDLLNKLQEKLPVKSTYITETIAKLSGFIENEKRNCQKRKPAQSVACLSPPTHTSLEFEERQQLPDEKLSYRYNTQVLYNPLPDVSPTVEAASAIISGLSRCGLESTNKLEQLQRYISIDTHRLEGDLPEITQRGEGATKTLVSLGFNHEVLSSLDIQNSSHIIPVLNNTLMVNRDMVSNIVMDMIGNPRKQLNANTLLDLHARLLENSRGTILYYGDGSRGPGVVTLRHFKLYPNSPNIADGKLHEYCPPHLTRGDLETFLERMNEYTGVDGINPYILAAWTHFAFVNIHPFMDGNGRMSRLLVSLVLIKAKLLPLLIRVEDKLRYFNALRLADGGDILDLASFIAGMQIQSKLFLLAGSGSPRKPTPTYLSKFQEFTSLLGQLIEEQHSSFTTTQDTDVPRSLIPFSVGVNSLRLLIKSDNGNDESDNDGKHSCVVLGTLRPYSLNLVVAYYFIWRGKEGFHPMEISCIFLEQPLQAQVHAFYNLIKSYFV
jgi:Fic family protein